MLPEHQPQKQHPQPPLFFDDSATGWFLRLLFFPHGLIPLLLAIYLLTHRRPVDNQATIKKAARLRIRDGSLRRLHSHEIKQLCNTYSLSKKAQNALVKDGVLHPSTCGLCLGNACKTRFLQLPCSHYFHVRCLQEALEQDLASCAECGWNMKSVFNIQTVIAEDVE